MNTQNSFLIRIRSAYILKEITENITPLKKLKIFNYSKKYQIKLNLTLFNYQEKYIEKFNIDWKKFLSIKYSTDGNNNYTLENNKIIQNINFLNQKLIEKLSENNIELNGAIIKEIAYNYFRNLKIKNKKDEYIFDGNKYIKN